MREHPLQFEPLIHSGRRIIIFHMDGSKKFKDMLIQHRNRDRLGNYYTTRHSYRISEGAVVNSDFAQGACGKDLFPAAREETQP